MIDYELGVNAEYETDYGNGSGSFILDGEQYTLRYMENGFYRGYHCETAKEIELTSVWRAVGDFDPETFEGYNHFRLVGFNLKPFSETVPKKCKD